MVRRYPPPPYPPSSYPQPSQPVVSWPRHVAEWTFILVAAVSLPFYYSLWLQRLLGGSQWAAGISAPLARYRGGVLRHWPQFSGLPLFGHRLFTMKVNPAFTPTWWPIITLVVGAVLQLIIAKFVPNRRIKELAGENWVILTTYLALALIISAVLDWNFLLIFILSVVVVFVYAGAYQLIAHLWDGVLNTIYHVVRLARIFLKNAAVVGTYIGEVFSDIIEFVRAMLDVIIAPFRWVNQRLTSIEDRLEDEANMALSQLGTAQGRTARQVPIGSCLVVTVFIGIIAIAALLVLRR